MAARTLCDRWLREVREQIRPDLGLKDWRKRVFGTQDEKWAIRGGIAGLTPNMNHVTLMTVWSVLTRTSLSSGFSEFPQTRVIPLRCFREVHCYAFSSHVEPCGEQDLLLHILIPGHSYLHAIKTRFS